MHNKSNQSIYSPTRVLTLSVDQQLGSTLHVLLQEHGYSTSGTNKINQAMDAIETGMVDILILDESQQNIRGTDILQRVMIHHPEIPVVFLTEDTHSNGTIEAILLGAYAIVAKPIDVGQLNIAMLGAKIRKHMYTPTSVSDLCEAPGCNSEERAAQTQP
jgi:DNA-binding NtrC family response regulator